MASDTGLAAVKMAVIAPHVMLVTIDREGARNAVNGEVAAGLERAVRAIEQDRDIRVAILTGTGTRAFCSGADLKEVAGGRVSTLFTAEGGFAGFTRMQRTKPWIAAVNGFAFAGGCEIALACDMIVASDAASFGLPEVKVGLAAGAGGIFRLPRKMPPNVAIEILLTGEALPANRALALGLVNRLASPDRLIDEAVGLGVKIAANSPSSVRETLRAVRVMEEGSSSLGWSVSKAAMERVARNSDFVEGPAAFVEKRIPIWRDEPIAADAKTGQG